MIHHTVKKRHAAIKRHVLRWPTHVHFVLITTAMFVTLLAPLLFFGQAHAVSKTWDGGCGVDTTWSCANNWSDNIVPASGDTVTFNSTSTNNSTVDASFAGTITTININSGYTGTISLSRSLTVSTTFSQAAGTFSAGSQTLAVTNLSLSAGSFTASSGTTSIGGDLTITGSPTFNANSGTVSFNGTAVASLACNNVSFSLVTFTHTTGTKTVNSNCNLPLGSNPAAFTGPVTLAGTLSGTGTITTNSSLTLNSGGALSGFSGLSVANTLTVNGTYNFGSYTSFSVSGIFALNSGGVFTAPSGTASFANTFTINSGATFNANGGTVNFNGTNAASLTCNSAVFNLVTFTKTAGSMTVNSGCNLPFGNNPTAGTGGSIGLSGGTISGSGTFSMAGSAGTLNMNSGGSFSGFTGLIAPNTTVSGTYDFSSYTTFTVAGSFALNVGGNFTAPSGTANFSSVFTLNSAATFNANGGTVNFNGTASVALSCGNKTFNLVTFTQTSSTKTVGSDCSLPLGANPNITGSNATVTLNGTLSGTGTLNMVGGGGTLNLNSGGSLSGFSGLTAATLGISGTYNFGSYTTFSTSSAFSLNATGNFTAPAGTASFASTFTLNSAATFNANGGTVNFNGSGNSTLSCGVASFNLVTFTHTGGTKTVSSTCNFPLGNNPNANSGGSITNNGTLSGTGTFTTSGTFTFGAGSTVSGFTGRVANALTINGTANYGSYTTFTVSGAFALNSGGSFTAPSGTASFASTFTLSSGSTFNANGGIVNFDGGFGTLTCNNAVFNLVTFNNLNTKTVGSNCTLPLGNDPSVGINGNSGLTLNGTLTGSGTLNKAAGFLMLNSGSALTGFTGLITHGTLTVNGSYDFGNYTTFTALFNFTLGGSAAFTAPSGTASFGGNLTLTTGSIFNANGGTVVLTGTSQTVAGNGPVFNNFTKIVSSADTLTFSASNSIVVAGTLTLKGVSGGQLSLVSTIPGTQWYIDAQGTTDVSYVNVADSHVLGAAITACDSTDSGGNTGWVFNPASCHTNDPGTTPVITNYALYQAALLNQAAQNQRDQAAAQSSSPSDDSLPSKIYDFARKFPAGKGLVQAAENFLKTLVVGVILGGLIGFFLVWKRRHKDDEEDTLPDAAGTIVLPTNPNVAPPGSSAPNPPNSPSNSAPTAPTTPAAGAPLPGSTVRPGTESPATPTDTDPLTGTGQKPEVPIGSNQGSPEPDNPPSKEDQK